MIAALLLAIFAAGSGAALLPSGTIHLSPATSPRATATSGLGAKTATGDAGNGGSPAVAQPPAITKAEAERVVSRYWQVNNQANESYSDSRLGHNRVRQQLHHGRRLLPVRSRPARTGPRTPPSS